MKTLKHPDTSTPPGHTPSIWNFLKQSATELGLCAVGVVKATQAPKKSRQTFEKWIRSDHHAGMSYMEKWREQRFDPRTHGIVENADAIVCVAMTFSDGYVSNGFWSNVSRYARGRDYHETLDNKLRVLEKTIQQQFPNLKSRRFVDAAPLLERTWALGAGLGTLGKSGSLIVSGIGPSVVLGEIVCANVPAPAPVLEIPLPFASCADCEQCMNACPTGAIVEPGVVDSRRCLSYHSIENRTDKLDDNMEPFINQVFGCDVCTMICPQRSPLSTCELEPPPVKDLDNASLSDVAALSNNKLQSFLKSTSLARTGAKTIKRNARLVLKNQHINNK